MVMRVKLFFLDPDALLPSLPLLTHDGSRSVVKRQSKMLLNLNHSTALAHCRVKHYVSLEDFALIYVHYYSLCLSGMMK